MDTKNKKGFTLVEVLIAMFILAIGIMAVVGMLTASLRSGSFGRATTVANRLVQQQLEEVKSITFSTMANNMCGYGLPQASGFTGACTRNPVNGYNMVFTNRSAVDYTVKYKVPGGLGDLSSVTYDVTMESVKNYPMKDVDMVTAKAKWTDVYGEHQTTAMTYIER